MNRQILLATVALSVLSACAHAQVEETRRVVPCYANVWTADAQSSRLAEKLDVVQALAGRAVRLGTGGGAYTGNGIERARVAAEALRARGLTAVMSINGRWSAERELTAEQVFRGGAAWGPFLAEYSDVFDTPIQIGNEINLQMRTAHDRNGGGAAGEAAALAVADQAVMLAVEFARGVRSTCPTCRVAPGSIGATAGGAGPYLRRLAPYVRDGTRANVLDAHIYRASRFFRRDARGRASLTQDFSAHIRGLLEEAGWPEGTVFRSTEANVVANTFRSPQEAAEGLTALLDALYAVPNAEHVCVFSPWPSSGHREKYMVQPGAPVGEAARRSAVEASRALGD